MLTGKKILIGITGSIAAYKAATLIRLFVKNGAEVKVIMTPAAAKFISPLTLSTLSKNPVYTDVLDENQWNNHVELGLWADAMIIAPLTASSLAKMANGMSDNIVVATYLSAKCPVFFAPAMDLDMWKHSATVKNVKTLISYENILLPVGKGELASGLFGEGRMAEPEAIYERLVTYFNTAQRLLGKSVVITAGPTFESLDPVRFIGNHSTGKMGIAIAEKCFEEGAEVFLILGPTHIQPTFKEIHTINVRSAAQMYEAASAKFEKADIAVLAAAVADYRPKVMATEKIKKKEGEMFIELERTVDIAATLGKTKTKDQIMVGFALETQNGRENALKKLKKKNFDFIVLNSLKDKGAGFGHDTNKVTFLDKDNNTQEFELKSKKAVAVDIIDKICSL